MVGCVVGLAWVLTAALGAGELTQGKLTRVQGQVWLTAAGALERVAVVEGRVDAGARLRTGQASLAEVTFDDGSLLQLHEGSALQLSKSGRQLKKSAVVLFFGRVWSKAMHVGGGLGTYEIKTANAVCRVGGTEFTTVVADDGTVRVQVEKGQVQVEGDAGQSNTAAGQQVDANENGVGAARGTETNAWPSWQNSRRTRLNDKSADIVAKITSKVMARKDRLMGLRANTKALQAQAQTLQRRLQEGDLAAAAEFTQVTAQWVHIVETIADLGDEADSQVALVDHVADLAADPRFAGLDGKTLQAQAKSLRKIKAMLDNLVADGTDISMAGMDQMMQDMGAGKRGGLQDKKGSSAKELFDDEQP